MSRPMPTDVVLVVDLANVLGSRPDGWWRDRRSAATRLLEAIGPLVGDETAGPDGESLRVARIVAVLEGAARGAAVPAAVEVCETDRDGDSAIVIVTENLLGGPPATALEAAGRAASVLVVTADRGLRRRLPPAADVVGPEWLNRLIGR